jgi:sulfite exporter TauE/SafE/copper chaperone CopZ
MKTITLHVSGTRCESCKIIIEDILNAQIGIERAEVNLKQETVSFETNLNDSRHRIAEMLTDKVKHNGYSFSVEKRKVEAEKNSGVIWQALPIGLIFLALFFLLQKSGLLNFGIGHTVTPATSFVIGLVASVSSCLAVVGGLVLSLSATISRDKVSDIKPMFLFHGGRLFSFALLGGVLGAAGGAIGVSFTLTAVLGIIAALVMITLGLNLVGALKKTVALPSGYFNFFRNIEHKTPAPFLLGAGTFFLPCGFTQTMQIVALSTGSFFSGMLIMLAFAIGTLPMLALMSFGSASFAHSKHAPLFFKSAGIVVIGLGIFALLSGLAAFGIINPLLDV